MTEKDFRKLVTDLELSKEFKTQVNDDVNKLEEILRNDLSKHLEIVDFTKIGSFSKGTMINNENIVDLLVVIDSKSDKTFKLLNQLVINEIMNIIAYNYPCITKASDIEFIPNMNYLMFNLNNVIYQIYIRYLEKDNIIEYTDYQSLIKHNEFVELANRDYTYFRNTISIIKSYRNEQKINISGHIIETLLYYGLSEYFQGNRYETYLNATGRAIDDFLKQKRIIVSKDIYNKLGIDVLSYSSELNKSYTIVDPTNPGENLVADINELKLNEYRKLRKILTKLSGFSANDLTKEQVVLNINPKVINDEYVWSFHIENSNYQTDGGSFKMTRENAITAMLKALSKGLKVIVENNLNKKQIKIVCDENKILDKIDLLSVDNNIRRKTIKAYIEVNGITIAK